MLRLSHNGEEVKHVEAGGIDALPYRAKCVMMIALRPVELLGFKKVGCLGASFVSGRPWHGPLLKLARRNFPNGHDGSQRGTSQFVVDA